MTLRILIADDHKLFREGLIGLMETREDLVEVVGEASTGSEAVSMVEQLLPDMVLMDIYMPGEDGLTALRQIKARFPKVQVVILTSSENDIHIYEAVKSGANGYLLKDLDARQFFNFINSLAHGEVAMTSEVASRLAKGMEKHAVDVDSGLQELTERELAVLRLVAVGASNQEIAGKLTISINTAKTHIRSIFNKLQLENRTQAANFAISHGLVIDQDKT
jgi:two-component system, NarL family, response regulator LiaR